METPVIMGWDAAWTPNGSGAWALAGGTHLLLHESCPRGDELLLRLRSILQTYQPCLIAMDFPLAKGGVSGWRTADLETTRAFSRYGCPVHSPSPDRPGRWGNIIWGILSEHGYSLGVETPVTDKTAVEVYPHTALLDIKRIQRRLPYKAGKTAAYWPALSRTERIERLDTLYRELWSELGGGPYPATDHPQTLRSLKRIEDLLDALICLRAARGVLAGTYAPYGDEAAAIWNPRLSPGAVPAESEFPAASAQ